MSCNCTPAMPCTECALRRALERVTEERNLANNTAINNALRFEDVIRNYNELKRWLDDALVRELKLSEERDELIRERDDLAVELVTAKETRDWLRKELNRADSAPPAMFTEKGPTK